MSAQKGNSPFDDGDGVIEIKKISGVEQWLEDDDDRAAMSQALPDIPNDRVTPKSIPPPTQPQQPQQPHQPPFQPFYNNTPYMQPPMAQQPPFNGGIYGPPPPVPFGVVPPPNQHYLTPFMPPMMTMNGRPPPNMPPFGVIPPPPQPHTHSLPYLTPIPPPSANLSQPRLPSQQPPQQAQPQSNGTGDRSINSTITSLTLSSTVEGVGLNTLVGNPYFKQSLNRIAEYHSTAKPAPINGPNATGMQFTTVNDWLSSDNPPPTHTFLSPQPNRKAQYLEHQRMMAARQQRSNDIITTPVSHHHTSTIQASPMANRLQIPLTAYQTPPRENRNTVTVTSGGIEILATPPNQSIHKSPYNSPQPQISPAAGSPPSQTSLRNRNSGNGSGNGGNSHFSPNGELKELQMTNQHYCDPNGILGADIITDICSEALRSHPFHFKYLCESIKLTKNGANINIAKEVSSKLCERYGCDKLRHFINEGSFGYHIAKALDVLSQSMKTLPPADSDDDNSDTAPQSPAAAATASAALTTPKQNNSKPAYSEAQLQQFWAEESERDTQPTNTDRSKRTSNAKFLGVAMNPVEFQDKFRKIASPVKEISPPKAPRLIDVTAHPTTKTRPNRKLTQQQRMSPTDDDLFSNVNSVIQEYKVVRRRKPDDGGMTSSSSVSTNSSSATLTPQRSVPDTSAINSTPMRALLNSSTSRSISEPSSADHNRNHSNTTTSRNGILCQKPELVASNQAVIVTYVIPDYPETFNCALAFAYSLIRVKSALRRIVMVPKTLFEMRDGRPRLREPYSALRFFYDLTLPIAFNSKVHRLHHAKIFALSLTIWQTVVFVEPQTIVLQNWDNFVAEQKQLPCTLIQNSREDNPTQFTPEKLKLCLIIMHPSLQSFKQVSSCMEQSNQICSAEDISDILYKQCGPFYPLPDTFVDVVNHDTIFQSMPTNSDLTDFHCICYGDRRPWTYYGMNHKNDYKVRLWIELVSELTSLYPAIAPYFNNVQKTINARNDGLLFGNTLKQTNLRSVMALYESLRAQTPKNTTQKRVDVDVSGENNTADTDTTILQSAAVIAATATVDITADVSTLVISNPEATPP